MPDSQIRKIALFFFYAFLDEPLALRAAMRAVREMSRMSKNRSIDSKIVYVTRRVWDRFRPQMTRGRYRVSGGVGWIAPDNADLTVWREFQKNGDEDEVLAVIWSQILKISDEDISKGLGVTRGTSRYRTARGLRKIGMIIRGEMDVARQ